MNNKNNFFLKLSVIIFTLNLLFEIKGQSILLEKNYGGAASEFAYSIQQTSDGGYFVVGYTASSTSGDVSGANRGSNDGWVVKLDAAGAITWQKNYGGTANDTFYAGQQTSDGGYVVTGYVASSANGNVSGVNKGSGDVWVVKLDATGNISWEKNYGGASVDEGVFIRQTIDGGYIVAGDTMSSVSLDVTGTNKGSQDAWVLKLDASGNITWQKNYGGSGVDVLQSLQETTDGGYILAGNTTSSASGDVSGANKGSNDVWVVKLDASGNITWQKNYGGSGADTCKSIQKTSDGGYVLVATTASSANGEVTGISKGGNDVWVVKLDATGAISWQKNYGGSGADTGASIQQHTDGGYILVAGTASSASGDMSGISKGGNDVWAIKTDSTGTISWQKNFGGSGSDVAQSMQITSDGNYIVSGYTSSSVSGDVSGINKGLNDFWVLKFGNPSLGTENVKVSNINMSPNPAKDFVTISNLTKGADVALFDMTGKLLYQTKSFGTTLTINTSSYKNGMYLVKVEGQAIKLLIAK